MFHQFNKDSGKPIEECKLKVLYASPSSADGNVEDEALRSSTRSLDGNSVSFVEFIMFVCGVDVILMWGLTAVCHISVQMYISV